MKNLLFALIFALSLAAGPARAQSYPNPDVGNVTVHTSLFLNNCSGVVIGNGPLAVTCMPVLSTDYLPVGTSGAAIPLLSTVNTWGAQQFFGSVGAVDVSTTTLEAQSATFQTALTLSYCTGVVIANGASPATCAAVLGAANLPTGTSGHVLPFLDGANTWSGAQTFGAISATSATIAALSVTDHLYGAPAATAVASCGTSPALSTGANDNHGTVTTGTGTPTSCTINFATARTNTPDCQVQSLANVAVATVVPGASSLTFTFTGTSSGKFTYLCMGQ